MNITVYSKPNCVQCDATKRLLNRENIKFTEVDLSTDPKALNLVKALGYNSAPVVIADNQHWSGYRRDLLQSLVDQNN